MDSWIVKLKLASSSECFEMMQKQEKGESDSACGNVCGRVCVFERERERERKRKREKREQERNRI